MGVTHERCRFCDRLSPIDFHVPDQMWVRAIPVPFQNKTLCVMCFIHFADQKRLSWEADIQFFPLSLATVEAQTSKTP